MRLCSLYRVDGVVPAARYDSTCEIALQTAKASRGGTRCSTGFLHNADIAPWHKPALSRHQCRALQNTYV